MTMSKSEKRKYNKEKKRRRTQADLDAGKTRFCYSCERTKAQCDFSKVPSVSDGLYYCKSCMGRSGGYIHNGEIRKGSRDGSDQLWLNRYSKEELQALRERRKKRLKEATPRWADKEKIKKIYNRARRKKMHVDHIVPLLGHTVCGLHVEDNLQPMKPRDNIRKGNSFVS